MGFPNFLLIFAMRIHKIKSPLFCYPGKEHVEIPKFLTRFSNLLLEFKKYHLIFAARVLNSQFCEKVQIPKEETKF